MRLPTSVVGSCSHVQKVSSHVLGRHFASEPSGRAFELCCHCLLHSHAFGAAPSDAIGEGDPTPEDKGNMASSKILLYLCETRILWPALALERGNPQSLVDGYSGPRTRGDFPGLSCQQKSFHQYLMFSG